MIDHVPNPEPDLRQRIDRLALLTRVAGQLINGGDAGELVRNLFELIAPELGFNAFVDYEVSDQEQLQLVACGGIQDGDSAPCEHLAPVQNACLQAIRQHAVVNISTIQHAFVCLPLLLVDRPLGAIALARREIDHFSSEDIRFLETMSAYVAMAKERLRGEAALRASEQRLAESEQRLRLGMQAAGFGIGEHDVAGGRFVYSPELRQILGLPLDEPVTYDTLTEVVHPEDRVYVLETRQARYDPRGSGNYFIEHRILWPNGEVRWLQARGHTIFEGEGSARRAVRVITAMQDITDRKRAELALAESEERLRLGMQVAGFGTCDLDLITRKGVLSPELHAIFGLPSDESVTADMLAALIHPEDRDRVLAATRAAEDPASNGYSAAEHRIIRPDGEIRWVQTYLHIFFAGEGEARRPARVISAVQDTTDRKQAELALAVSEERLRLAQELGGVGSFDWNMLTDEVEVSNVYRGIYGLPLDVQIHFSHIEDLVHPDDRQMFDAATVEAREGKGQLEAEYRVIRPSDGEVRWIRAQGGPVRDSRSKSVRMIGIVSDVTERRRDQERERLLMREVDHRARNLLSVVQSVIQLTQAPSTAEFIAAVKGRIQALARVHTLLAGSRWEGAELTTLVREELAPFGLGDDRISINGPVVELTPAAAQALALVIHELASNAAKYGALSVADGHVAIGWSVDAASGELRLWWQEHGGPPVTPPTRQGFGSTVFKTSIEYQLNGRVHMDWQKEGLQCELTLPAKYVARVVGFGGTSQQITSVDQPAPAPRRANILILEDEALIAVYMARVVEQRGYSVLGPAATVTEVLDILSHQHPDAALLDIDLGGNPSFAAADALAARGIAFAFLTGFGRAVVPKRFERVAIVEKPAEPETIRRTIERLLGRETSQTAGSA